jgi:hypothetical protein
MGPFPQSWCLGNILFVQFDKGIQSGKNAFYIHNVGIALDAFAPMVFAEILSKEFIDMTGQKNVDRRIQKLLWRQSKVFAPIFPIDLSQTVIASLLVDAIFLEIAFGHDEGDDFKGIHSMSPGSMEDQTGIPQSLSFGKLIFSNQPDHARKMQNFFYADVGGFCAGKKFTYSGWKVGSCAPWSKKSNVFYQDKNGNGHDENDCDGFQDGVEHYPFFQFRVKLACRMTWNHMDVEKPHFSSSSFETSIFFSSGPNFWPMCSF